MPIATLSTFQTGDTTVQYQLDDASKMVGLIIYPTALAGRLATSRETYADGPEYANLPGWTFRAWNVDPLVQVKWIGAEPPAGFAQGRTMRNGAATFALKFDRQEVVEEGGQKTIVTHLKSDAGYAGEHRLMIVPGATVRVVTRFVNGSDRPVTLEMLSSFALGGITPFAADDAPDRLRLHRFRSYWAVEGRLDTQTIEQLHLEPSWAGHGVRSERFGQVGSMPTTGFFPAAAVEDVEAGVLWGVQLAWAGSWQIEAYRRDDCLGLSGGLADREFGHWTRTLAPGESLTTPAATLAVVQGDLDALMHRLTGAQEPALAAQPSVEQDLPIIFNEWCTSWGNPSHEAMIRVADRLRASPVKYLVIDAGWYKPENANWANAQGDWQPSPKLYPQGLKATADAIRERGLIPGIWFEMEVAGPAATAFSLTDLMLRRDGLPITVGGRRFWDLNNDRAADHLAQRVIGTLRDCDFGYLKVDYNENIGVGTDHAESPGEGLRRQIEGVYRLFERIRRELPDLVVECCSSGGHRLEPSMMALCAMGSFSDAHETREIPIVAANLHRLILPCQNQIWAVMRASDDRRRLAYSLAAGFLGRLCLSGDIGALSGWHWDLAQEAMRLYGRVAPIIKHGRSWRLGPAVTSYRHPKGWQAVVRVSDAGDAAVGVVHGFGQPLPAKVEFDLPAGDAWSLAGSFHVNAAGPEVAGRRLSVPLDGEFAACVVHLTRRM